MPVYLTFALKTAGWRDSKAADPVPSPGDGSWPHSSLEGAPLVLGDLTGGAPLVTGDSRVASWAPLEVHHPDASTLAVSFTTAGSGFGQQQPRAVFACGHGTK